jgi:predicted MPP superfamily phosphohydrolase
VKKVVQLLFIALLAALWALPASGHGVEARPDTLRIGVIGDQTGVDDLDAAYVWLERGVAALNGRGLDIVLHVGDLIESAYPEDRVQSDFSRAAALLDALDVPWMLTPGDHDINPPGRVSNSPDRSREALFLEMLRGHDPELGETFYRSRRVNGWRIIALYSHDHLHADPRWGVTYLARLSGPQIAWLRDELRDASGDAGIIVLIHQPLWYNWAAWSEVHQLLADAGVSLVISGHTHYPQIEPAVDGITYLTVGATGGSTKSGSRAAGGVHHVTEITLATDSLQITGYDLSSEPPAAFDFSPRAAMDRVQAVDVMLGSSMFALRPDPESQPEACPAGWTVALPPIGNPIDLPLRVDITLPAGINEYRFREGACSESSDTQCIVPPAHGVIFSNNSSVSLSDLQPPFFEARFNGTRAVAGALMLGVSAAFEIGGESYRLGRDLPVRLSCR